MCIHIYIYIYTYIEPDSHITSIILIIVSPKMLLQLLLAELALVLINSGAAFCSDSYYQPMHPSVRGKLLQRTFRGLGGLVAWLLAHTMNIVMDS